MESFSSLDIPVPLSTQQLATSLGSFFGESRRVEQLSLAINDVETNGIQNLAQAVTQHVDHLSLYHPIYRNSSTSSRILYLAVSTGRASEDSDPSRSMSLTLQLSNPLVLLSSHIFLPPLHLKHSEIHFHYPCRPHGSTGSESCPDFGVRRRGIHRKSSRRCLRSVDRLATIR